MRADAMVVVVRAFFTTLAFSLVTNHTSNETLNHNKKDEKKSVLNILVFMFLTVSKFYENGQNRKQNTRCLKINIASEASYVYIRKAKQCYQTGHF